MSLIVVICLDREIEMAGSGHSDPGGGGGKPGGDHGHVLDHQAMLVLGLLSEGQDSPHLVQGPRSDLHPRDQLDSHVVVPRRHHRFQRH